MNSTSPDVIVNKRCVSIFKVEEWKGACGGLFTTNDYIPAVKVNSRTKNKPVFVEVELLPGTVMELVKVTGNVWPSSADASATFCIKSVRRAQINLEPGELVKISNIYKLSNIRLL